VVLAGFWGIVLGLRSSPAMRSAFPLRHAVLATPASREPSTREIYETILERIRGLPVPLRAVSGKDFVLPLVDFQLQSLGCRVKRRSLRVRLATAANPTLFAALADALHQAATG